VLLAHGNVAEHFMQNAQTHMHVCHPRLRWFYDTRMRLMPSFDFADGI
jgi:hypothetical protein